MYTYISPEWHELWINYVDEVVIYANEEDDDDEDDDITAWKLVLLPLQTWWRTAIVEWHINGSTIVTCVNLSVVKPARNKKESKMIGFK